MAVVAYLFLMFLLAGALALALLAVEREFSGARGGTYAEVCDDLYRETERRGELLAAYAKSLEERIERLEQR